MIEPVEKYRTNDGQLFDTRKKAENHVIDMVGETLDIILTRNLPPGHHTRADIFKSCAALAGDVEKCRHLYRCLHGIMEEV